MQYKKNRHSAYLLHAHIVFVTKYRRKVLSEVHQAFFSQSAAQICQDFKAELKECNGEPDHIHMLIEYPPTVQLTKMINSLKAVSSRKMRREFADLAGAYSKSVLWSRAYFVSSCGGAPLDVIKNYIQNQQG